MSQTTANEAVAAFSSAKNLNAAVKAFLKKDVRNTPALERLAKDFRSAASNPERLRAFVDKNFEKNELVFLAIARYAFPELVNSTVEAVIEKHADTFNTTYERSDGGVVVTDKAKFSEIIGDVRTMVRDEQAKAGVEGNVFLKRAVLSAIFEPDVLPRVNEVYGE